MSILKNVYEWFHPKPAEPEKEVASDTAESLLATIALESAMRDLANAQGQRASVAELVSRIENQGTRNHFAEMVEASMRGKA